MAHDQRSDVANGDLTPEVGSATDVAPLGRGEPKPAHELTATEDSDPVNWSRVTQLSEFRIMVRAKLRFIIPATLFFVVYYFALPVLVGYAPGLMSKKVLGVVNIAYLFALSQFFMAWIIAALYIRAAAKFDKLEHKVIEKAIGATAGSENAGGGSR
jgi:uncharacterized membrane protein (DUF485 family)